MLLVVKRSGNVEQFDRNKVISGVRKACQGRPINEDDLKMLGQKVEEDLRSRGLAQVKSDEVGKAILKPLRDLDMVAYMRFASVYQNFENLEDFQRSRRLAPLSLLLVPRLGAWERSASRCLICRFA